VGFGLKVALKGINRLVLSLFSTERAQSIVAVRLFSIQCVVGSACALIEQMAAINEAELGRIVEGLLDDRDLIIKHNPIGTPAETMLWMLLSCLVSYLSLTDSETPCFTGRPDAETYREAIRFVLRNHSTTDFDAEPYLAKLSTE
jgi:hypothetical protein